jgi:glycosyltransferase involved in cell wall biosynthesis
MVLRNAICVIVPSSWLKNQLVGVGIDSTKIAVIPNPVDSIFFEQTDWEATKSVLEFKKTKPILTFIAHSVNDTRKGLHYFMDAIEYLAEKQKYYSYLIVGSGSSNHARGNEIYCMEYVSSVEVLRAIYAISDCVVVPSLIDSLNQVSAESQSSGTRVIVSNKGGIPETVIAPNLSGIILESLDASTLANAIDTLLKTEWTSESRDKIKKIAHSKWGTEAIAKTFKDLIRGL